MISNLGMKRKSSSSSSSGDPNLSSTPVTTLTKRFRGLAYDGKINQHEPRMSLLSNTVKKMNMINGDTSKPYKRLEESELTPAMLVEYRRLQHELQCQEALLVLMQKLKTNQRLVSQANSNGLKQRATATKLNQQPAAVTDSKTPLTATKQPQQPLATNNANRSTPTKSPHPNQYTANRSNPSSQLVGQSSSKSALPQAQATRQSNHATNNNSNNVVLPAAATRLSSTVPASATKTSSIPSTTSNASKSNGVAAEQHLLNAKLALRKQLEQTLLQIPTPKPSTCDLTFIPGVNGWSEFLAFLGLEQAYNTHADIVNRRPPSDISMTMPHVCAQCGTDWSVTWHEMSSANDSSQSLEEKILCDRCTKTSQKKLLKQDHSNRLRQAFIKALQQEKELDAKFQNQSATNTSTTTTIPSTTSAAVAHPPSTTSSMKHPSSSSSSQAQPSSKHLHSSSKHSTKPVSTKNSSNHHQHHHNSTSNNHNHHSHHHHHHSSKSSSSGGSSKSHHNHSSNIANLTPSPAETLASTLAALQTNEQMELFQKHFLSNMLPFAVANQAAAAAAMAAKSTQQQQQQALAAFPAMAASLMRQQNPAQYLLDMIPQAAKQQQQQHHHHHHSK